MFAAFSDEDRKVLLSWKARYHAMVGRCDRPNTSDYKWYGARGIECRFYHLYEFIRYVRNLPGSRNLTLEIDRKDNNGHYEPGNIRFVTHRENCSNKRHWRHEEKLQQREYQK